MPPYLIPPPQRPLLLELFSIPLLLNLLIQYLIQLEIAPSQRPFLPFLITTLTVKFFEVTFKYLVEPHRHRFCCFFCGWFLMMSAFDSSVFIRLFQSVLLDCKSSYFALQVYSRIFFVSSLPTCGGISLILHSIIDSIIFFLFPWLFRLEKLFKGWAHILLVPAQDVLFVFILW